MPQALLGTSYLNSFIATIYLPLPRPPIYWGSPEARAQRRMGERDRKALFKEQLGVQLPGTKSSGEPSPPPLSELKGKRRE